MNSWKRKRKFIHVYDMNFVVTCSALKRAYSRFTESHSYGTSLAIWDHTVTVTYHPTQVNAPASKLVANCVHTADADATQLESSVASASAYVLGFTVRTFLLSSMQERQNIGELLSVKS